MTTYQGPHASVRQIFKTTPGAVSIENLPPAVVASAFDVFVKENLGSSYGIINQDLEWGADKVVYDTSVIDERSFDFYPATVFIKNNLFGNIEFDASDITIAETGVTVTRDADYSIPGVENEAGASSAIMPYYKKESNLLDSGTTDSTEALKLKDSGADFVTAGVLAGHLAVNTTDNTAAVITVVAAGTLTLDSDIFVTTEGYEIYSDPMQILATNLQEVLVPKGSVATSQIKPGQKVFIKIDTTWTLVGTVGPQGVTETKIYLATAYSAAISGQAIVVGAFDSSTITIPNTFYDENANFVTQGVKVGDLLYFSSLSISESTTTPKVASIVSVEDKMLRINTEDLSVGGTVGRVDYDFLKYKYPLTFAPQSTISIYSYDVKRLVGFSQNYGLKLLNSTGVAVTKVSSSQFTIAMIVGTAVPAMAVGDIFIITTANIASGTNERDAFTYVRPYRIKTITNDGTNYTITVDDVINVTNNSSTETEYTTGFIHAWTPKLETEIVADFRAIRSEEEGVVKRITSEKDIFDAWVRTGEETIDPRNELAYMVFIAFQRSGGKVCYGVNVDPSGNAVTNYSDALEELKLIDCYSHAFGTTDPGVNALMSSYCNSESEPYEGHEKIGIICFDEDDVYLQGTDTGSIASTGLITLSGGAFNPITAGVTVKDTVKIYDINGVFKEEVTVTETPTTTTQIQTDGETAYAAHTFKFMSGRKSDQAVKIGNLGMGERRVAVLWPGWFYGEVDGETMLLPPYFMAAAIIGMDSAIVASQSFTNMPFAIPGVSNISLNTNTYFRKAELDEIGGSGIDVMIQDASVSQTIKSRHDLTSNMDAIQYRERSITKQADVAAKTLRNTVAPYVGRYNITTQVIKFLGDRLAIAKSKLLSDSILYDIQITKIERDEVIDDKINIYVEATAFIAGNYYDITMLVKTR